MTFIQPAVFAYNNTRYQEAATLLDGLNNFFVGFGVGITNLPKPTTKQTGLQQELTAATYSKKWFDMYFPLIAKSMGKYLRETIDLIKEERGTS